MPPKLWKTMSSRIVYQNPWTKIREDIAEMPNGKQTIYGVMENVDAVGILPFVDDDHVMMVRQYRYVFHENHRWEMPTGAVKGDETHEVAARRELREESAWRSTSRGRRSTCRRMRRCSAGWRTRSRGSRRPGSRSRRR